MDNESKANTLIPKVYCDHICLNDDGHVERGEPHFYGYRSPISMMSEQMRNDIIVVARHVRSHTDRPYEEADRLLVMLGDFDKFVGRT